MGIQGKLPTTSGAGNRENNQAEGGFAVNMINSQPVRRISELVVELVTVCTVCVSGATSGAASNVIDG